MAVTSIWPIKSRIDVVINYAINPEKTTDKYIEDVAAMHTVANVLEYTTDSIKTEERKYVTCINCHESNAVQQFNNTKRLWGKTDGRLAYHGYQSFKQDEVTAETAHEIGVKLAKRLWGDRFEVVVATHLNTGHYHSHFVINSVSFADGYKFYNSKADYQQMKNISDEICREYGLSVIQENTGKSKPYSEWKAEQNGNLTIRDTIRNDIDRAVKASYNEAEFVKVMMDMGYEFKTRDSDGNRLKYPSLKPPGAKGYFRFHKLGYEYDIDRILNRVDANWIKKEPFPDLYIPKNRYYGKINGNYSNSVKRTGLYSSCILYCYELRNIKKHPTSVKKVSMAMREDIRKLETYSYYATILGKFRINTIDELQNFRDTGIQYIDVLEKERNSLRNELRRLERNNAAPELIQAKKQDISDKSTKMKTWRKMVKATYGIEERSAQIDKNLKELAKEKTENRNSIKKKNKHRERNR